MTKKTCLLYPQVTNSKGEYVDSQLFQDLLDIFPGERTKVKKLYNIATHEDFVNNSEVQYKGKFDENGQITAHSFIKLAKIAESESAEIKALQKKYNINSSTFDEALARIEEFNSKEATEDYVTTLEELQESGMYRLGVAKRTEFNTAQLQEILENNVLTKQIISTLRNLGVDYDFVDNAAYEGRFSTKKAKRLSDGLYHLITLAKGENVVDALVEEASHLAVHSLKDTNVINRLLATINEDNIPYFFTEEEIATASLAKNAKLELAGMLVKKMMLKQEPKGFTKFFDRVLDFIYSIFRRVNLDRFINERKQAYLDAKNIAYGFLNNEDKFSVEEATKRPATLYSLNNTHEAKAFHDVMGNIAVMNTKLRNASSVIYKKYKDLNTRKYVSVEDESYIEDELLNGYTCSAVNTLLTNLTELLPTLHNRVQYDSDSHVSTLEYDTELVNTYFEVSQIINTLANIRSVLSEYVENVKEIYGPGDIQQGIIDVIQTIDNVLEDSFVKGELLTAEKLIAADFLEEALGRKSIQQLEKVCLKDWTLVKESEKKYVFRSPGTNDVNTINLLNAHIADFNEAFMDSPRLEDVLNWVRTHSNARDLTVQILNKALMKVKVNQNRMYHEALEELKSIKDSYKGNLADFYERTSDGIPTGFFISEVNLGQFHFEKKNVIDRVKKDFVEELKLNNELDKYNMLSYGEKKAIFNNYLEEHPLYKNFIIDKCENSDFNTPNKKVYLNKEYQRLKQSNPEFATTLRKLKEFKARLDEQLTEYTIDAEGKKRVSVSHGIANAIPRFEGKQVAASKRFKELNKSESLYGQPLEEEFVKNLASENFGSEVLTEDTEFMDDYEAYRSEMKRLPLYGINNLSDLSKLSTDLFTSLAIYANMAFRYGTLQNIYSQLQITIDVLNKRSKPNDKSKSYYGENSKRRIEDLEDTYVYEDDSKFSKLAKFFKGLGSFASITTLALSVRGAVKNLGGGLLILFHDSIGGTAPFTFKNLLKIRWKTRWNFGHKTQIAKELFTGREATDKWSNLLRRWDGLRGSRVDARSIKQRNKFFSVKHLINFLMANYSITDNKIMGWIYGSSFLNKKYFDSSTGKYISGLDVYSFDEHNIPTIKKGILLEERHALYYNKLTSAISALRSYDYTILVGELKEIAELQDFCTRANVTYKTPSFNWEDLQRYSVTPEEVESMIQQLQDLIKENKLEYDADSEFDTIYEINDYVISSQGVYGAMNATFMQSTAFLESLGRMKGYLFGNIQRNVLSNNTINNTDFKNSIFGAELVALATVFSFQSFAKDRGLYADKDENGKDTKLSVKLKQELKLRGSMLWCMVMPYTSLNKQARDFLRSLGYSKDLLDKIGILSMAVMIQIILLQLGKLVWRGNLKRYGTLNFKKDAGDHRKIKKEEPGLLFRYINENVCPLLVDSNHPDVELSAIYEEKVERSLKNLDDEKWEHFEFYEEMAYYKHLEYGDKNNPWGESNLIYWGLGNAYSFISGVLSEHLSRNTPIRFIADVAQLASSPIFWSQCVNKFNDLFFDLVEANPLPGETTGETLKRVVSKETYDATNWFLKKFGMELVEEEDEEGNVETKVVPMDTYDRQKRTTDAENRRLGR